MFAVNECAMATPLELVTAVFTPPAKVPLGPEPGAVNATVTPGTTLEHETQDSVAVAAKFVANVAPMPAD